MIIKEHYSIYLEEFTALEANGIHLLPMSKIGIGDTSYDHQLGRWYVVELEDEQYKVFFLKSNELEVAFALMSNFLCVAVYLKFSYAFNSRLISISYFQNCAKTRFLEVSYGPATFPKDLKLGSVVVIGDEVTQRYGVTKTASNRWLCEEHLVFNTENEGIFLNIIRGSNKR